MFQNAPKKACKRIAVMSGKGGVGKSTVSLLAALYLSQTHKTLLIDADVCGPSITAMLNLKGGLVRNEKGFEPLEVTPNLHALSFGQALKPEDAVVWRGPKKNALLNLFLDSAEDYDCVIIDTPPGISEEHKLIKEQPIDVLLVTTSQNVSLNDTQRLIEYLEGGLVKIAGIVENMSYLVCGCCKERIFPFGRGGGKVLSTEYALPFLGELEVDTSTSHILDVGRIVEEGHTSRLLKKVGEIVEKME